MRKKKFYNLERLMRSAGIKKTELARLLNVTRPTIYHKFNGSSDFTLEEAIKIKEFIERRLDVKWMNLFELFEFDEITENEE